MCVSRVCELIFTPYFTPLNLVLCDGALVVMKVEEGGRKMEEEREGRREGGKERGEVSAGDLQIRLHWNG